MIVMDVLRTKGQTVWSTHPDSTVYEALQLMAEKDVGALLVLDALSDRVVGIFSERDYARKVILKGRSSLSTAVNEIMSEKVYYVRPSQTLEECMALMTEQHIRHLPVLDGPRLMGVISIGDVVRQIVVDQNLVIQQLENYISGGESPLPAYSFR